MFSITKSNLNFHSIGGVFLFMVYVKKNPGESDDALIRKFTKKVIDAQIVQEARRRQFYLKPSLAKKAKQEEARRTRKRIA